MSMSFQSVLKYGVYVFIGAWMFLLGIMVGRGTAPVTFDTRGFQERLQDIVSASEKDRGIRDLDGKIVLHYYDALNEAAGAEEMTIPVFPEDAEDTPADIQTPSGMLSEPENKDDALHQTLAADEGGPDGAVPVKYSKKAATLNSVTAPGERPAGPPGTGVEKTASSSGPVKEVDPSGRYTIQVAAFQSFMDAVTQMTLLDEKGFAATRTTKRIDDVTWYRVRVGTFATRDAAAQYLSRLNQAGINGMIIIKD